MTLRTTDARFVNTRNLGKHGRAYFDQALPCGSTTLLKFSTLLGADGVEELLAQAITVAVSMKIISPRWKLASAGFLEVQQVPLIAHTMSTKKLPNG